MSDETEPVETTETEAVDAVVVDHAESTSGNKSRAHSIHTEVAEIISKSNDDVRKRVINSLVEEKLKKHESLILDGLGKLKTMRTELEQLKKKGKVVYGLDGKPAGAPVFEKAQVEEMKKAQEKLTKLEKALELALEKGDYTKLAEAGK
jgi:hypothetical protein